MYLSRLFINNYRSIGELDLEFREGKNVIVGKNNSGKSNIVKAIDLVLGENSPDYQKSSNVTENDFHKGDTSKDIVVLAVLTRGEDEALNYEEINKCWGYYIQGTNQWVREGGRSVPVDISPIRVPLDEDNHEDLIADVKSVFEVDFDDSGTSKVYINPKLRNQESFKNQLDDKYQFAFLFYATYDSESKIVSKDLRFLYREDDEHEWVLASKASVRNELMQSAIIPAFRDPQNQLRANNYSWYGKLLQNYIDNDNPELKKAFESVKEASTKVFSALKKQIGDSRVKVAFPDTEISFQFNPDTKQDIYKSALIYVDDGFNSLLQDKGSGIQSAVIIGLFDFYVRNISHVSSSLLAIEEPELYLHPHGRRVISNRLEDFLEGKKNQIIITTHSPEFITSTEKDLNILLVKKDGGETSASSTFFENPKDKRLLLKGQNTEMFFADYVVLVEGGDKYILDATAKGFGTSHADLEESWLDDRNVSIVSASGKGEFPKYSKKLKELGIPWMVCADFDFLRRGLSEYLTGLGVPRAFIQRVDTLKSEIATSLGTDNEYKKISDVPQEFHKRINTLREEMIKKDVFLFSGELEDLYTQHAREVCSGLTKEETAICIASEITIGTENDFINMGEITDVFNILAEKI